MNDSIFDWLDEGARADIEKMRQPKPMPPAKKEEDRHPLRRHDTQESES